MFLFASIQVVESGLELRDRGLVRIEGRPQFSFAVAQIFRPFLQNLLPPRELAFFSLEGGAFLLQRLLPSRQDRRGFRDFSLKLRQDRKSTRLNSSHVSISYAVFCLKKKNKN